MTVGIEVVDHRRIAVCIAAAIERGLYDGHFRIAELRIKITENSSIKNQSVQKAYNFLTCMRPERSR